MRPDGLRGVGAEQEGGAGGGGDSLTHCHVNTTISHKASGLCPSQQLGKGHKSGDETALLPCQTDCALWGFYCSHQCQGDAMVLPGQ